MPFVADPGQTYKLWIRLKADGNSWSNDSVWVQFSGAVDTAGNAVYRNGDAETMAQAEAIVQAHVASHPEIMAIPAAERQAAHARF